MASLQSLADAQKYPEHCGYNYENRCALPSKEQALELWEEYPDAIVEINKELYESIPEDDREDAEGIIDKGPLEQEESSNKDNDNDRSEDDSSEDDSSSSINSNSNNQQNNFQPIPPDNENLPPA